MNIEDIIDTYKDNLYKLCMKLTNNKIDADDLFQDTWLKLYKNFYKIDKQKSIKNWIYTICINIYRDNYSKKKRWLNIIVDFFDSKTKHEIIEQQSTNECETEITVLDNIEKNIIKDMINELDDKYRLPIILFYYSHYSYSEIANILSLPIGTVKFRLNTGKKLLKRKLESINFKEGCK
ncbi:RNA polymerase sigma factor [Clostridium tepidiprofundi]|uniref:RNA polymerase sigma factor n=1 Tax=Clostridium tepidiprofundi TaxID=420412 RepID=UPI000A0565C8|nr:RNA polymerase sigma factor [Clostridium tepidiprofundi]